MQGYTPGRKALHKALMERHGGSFEAKAGAHAKRARQEKATRREIREALKEAWA